jgi:hypothetical protein
VPQVIKHHRTRPDLSDRIGNPLAGNVRRRAVYGLEHARVLALRIQIGRWRDTDGPSNCGTEIGEDIAKQIAGNDNIEPIGVQYEMRSQDIDMVLIGTYIGILFGNGAKALVPIRHRVDDAIRLGGRRQVPRFATARQLKGVTQNAVDTLAGENAFLYCHLELGIAVKPSANL